MSILEERLLRGVHDVNCRFGPQGRDRAGVPLSFLAQVESGDSMANVPLDCARVAGNVADGRNDVIMVQPSVGAELVGVSDVVGKPQKQSQRVVLEERIQRCSGSVESINRPIAVPRAPDERDAASLS